MKHLLGLGIAFALAGCPGKQMTVYHSPQDPGADTCLGNAYAGTKVVQKVASTKDAAKAEGDAAIRRAVDAQKACGILLYNDFYEQVANGIKYQASFEICRCK